MAELLDQLETENPDDPGLAPKTLAEWATLYLRYVGIVRKLDEAYDQMVHPQKRPDVRRALDAALGRTMEVRAWLVRLNDGIDRIPFEEVLADLKLPPEATELPVPRYFITDRAKELEDRSAFLEELMKKYGKEPTGENLPLGLPSASFTFQPKSMAGFGVRSGSEMAKKAASAACRAARTVATFALWRR